MADHNTPERTQGLSPEHVTFLESQAVDVELALSLGVRSLLSRADNPQEGVWGNWANHPAILFPWTNEAGQAEFQVRPDNPTEDTRGRARKYVFRKDMIPILWAVRPVKDAEKILIVEGTKQCLAAATYAPPGVGVYGIAGCRSWQIDGQPIDDLMAADGREVVVILDADASDNPQVYDAGVKLAEALAMEGASKVSFGQLPSGGKAGLDDVLAKRPETRRASYLARVIDSAESKPAKAKPKTTAKKKGEQGPPEGEGDRTTIICNRDRRTVINDLTAALITRWDGRELFNHGGVISRLREAGDMKPVDRGSFHDLVQETAMTVNENDGANGVTYTFTWPDAGTMSATMSRADRFSPLERISHAPFVRSDGSVAAEPGYDKTTRTLLSPDPVFGGIKVPDAPTGEQIAAARQLIMTEWLGDFPVNSDADRANLLAAVVTPAVRGMIPKVPLLIVDGLQMGVGKNLLADSILTVYTGSPAQPMNWVSDPDELRKQITAAFRTGQEFFVFDEAHTVEGAPLAQALTANTWQDRILGVSTMAEFPNRVTWMSLGNQVQVKGDLSRRVYRVALRPDYANPQDRKAESFRHPGLSGLDLASWTQKHRRELLTAILTLVRAWFDQGQPRPSRGISFGSFETWERIVGGIVETAGVTGFLDNLKVWRSESDFDSQYWTQHLLWLQQMFAAEPFRTAEVRAKALTAPESYQAPPRLDDPSEKTYGKHLGEAYSRLRGRRYGDLWLDRVSSAHGNVSLWQVYDQNDLPPAPEEPPVVDPEPDPDSTPEPKVYPDGRTGCSWPDDCPTPDKCERGCAVPVDSEVSTDIEPDNQPVDKAVDETSQAAETTPVKTDIPPVIDTVTFDLETGDAEDLYNLPGEQFVRIGATGIDDRPVEAFGGPAGRDVAEEVTARFWKAGTITGHNIMAFDLPALVRAGTITMPEIHRMAAEGKLFDGLLAGRYLDPPMAKDKGVDAQRRYDLGTLAVKHGLGEKYTDVSKPLATKYGGWGAIPIDLADPDPERAADAADFQRYMVQDVELSRRLHARLLEELGGEMPEYLKREHRVAALAAQVRHNGFLVDQELLHERVTTVNERKAGSLAWLAEHAGVPLADAKGKEYKSPLATKLGKEALENALREAGATSLWRTANSGQFDTSGEHMKHLAREYNHLLRVREIAKHVYRIVGARSVYQTALDNLCPDGRVHPKIGFDQATGRWSVTRPGLTVFGKRGGRHVERAIFLPDPGEVLISADLSQVDMRAVAGLSQDHAYIEMLKHDDPHSQIAIELFGDVGKREIAKAVGHGWNYGRGIRAISESHDIDPAIVRQFDQSMRERFSRLVEWQGEVRALAESGALLDNGFGRQMRADPHRAHTQAPALMGQGAARDIMMEGLLRLPEEIRPMLRAQIHDEIVLSVPEKDAAEIGRAVVEALSFEWRGVPIGADVSRTGTDWSLCYAKD